MKIVIAGDTVPTRSNWKFFSNGDTKALFGDEIVKIFHSADFRVLNLEAPLINEGIEKKKCGPHLYAPTSTVKGIKELKVDLVTLANNHIMDYDEQGLRSTCEVLKSHNIKSVGAGENLSEASKPYIYRQDGMKIGIYACAEHEFSIADCDAAGANPYEPLDSMDHIAQLHEECDYLIVLYHGGKEFYRYPSPYLQKICRKMVEKGADIVIAQHSHCVGAKEEYKDGTILYGQGNFLFDGGDDEYWRNGLIVEINIDRGCKDVLYYPIVKKGNLVRLAGECEKEKILEGFYVRSADVVGELNVKQKYDEFAENNYNMYLRMVSGNMGTNIFLKILYKVTKGNIMKLLYSEKSALRMINFIECEAHRELLLTGLKRSINKK